MLLRVRTAVADEACRRHRFLVGLPGLTRALDFVRDVGGVDPARGAVGRYAERGCACQCEVVRQAWMRGRGVARRESALGGKAVDVRGGGAADDLAVGVVLHDDDEDVAERWHPRGLYRCHHRHQQRGPKGCEDCAGQPLDQEAGIVDKWPGMSGPRPYTVVN